MTAESVESVSVGEDQNASSPIVEDIASSTHQILRDFLDFSETVTRLVARGKRVWDDDEMIRLAGEAIIHRIGEVAARLCRDDPAFMAEHPEVRWREMRSMRNLVAHEYDIIDHDLLWAALSIHLLEERRRVQQMVDRSRRP